MLSEKEKRDLTKVMAELAKPDMPWSALPHLAEMAARGTDITIDYSTRDTLGAPVIIADRRTLALPVEGLTPRQAEVCALLAKGTSNKVIAKMLEISPATVKDHVHAILQRLGLQSRSEVIAYLHRSKT
jgi:DNA-binding NarL/FixJ family response regulator